MYAEPQNVSPFYRNICENGLFVASSDGRPRTRTVWYPNMKETILNIVDKTLLTSTRAIACRVHVSQFTVWRVLNKERLHLFHIQRVQTLQVSDYSLRVEFYQWFMQQCALQPNFPAYVPFTDEATFTQASVFNVHNTRVWATENPNPHAPHSFQKCFSITVWVDIVNDFLIGPYLSYQNNSMAHLSYFSVRSLIRISARCSDCQSYSNVV